jgi:tetratricopeptide (TPR) repeat protein
MAEVEGSLDALLSQGNQAWARGQREDAKKYYEKIVEGFPDQPDGYNKLGVFYAETGNLLAAERHFLTALERNRAHVPSLSNLGNIYLERGDLNQAITYYAWALESDPEYPPAHHNLAVAYRKKGDMGVFVRHLKKSQRFERQRDRLAFRQSGAKHNRFASERLPDRWWIWAMVLILMLLALGRTLR